MCCIKRSIFRRPFFACFRNDRTGSIGTDVIAKSCKGAAENGSKPRKMRAFPSGKMTKRNGHPLGKTCELMPRTAGKSALGKALHYLQEQWSYLVRYPEDGRLELSNNHAERSIKPFVMGRKNWLFVNTPAGAQSSSVIYSLIETAKENALDPYRYLVWILQEVPKLAQRDTAWAKHFLPCEAPDNCKVLAPGRNDHFGLN